MNQVLYILIYWDILFNSNSFYCASLIVESSLAYKEQDSKGSTILLGSPPPPPSHGTRDLYEKHQVPI